MKTIFKTKKCVGVDGEVRFVSVLGVYTVTKEYVSTEDVKQDGKTMISTVTEYPKRCWNLDITFTIKNPNDKYDEGEAYSSCVRRHKRGMYHLNLHSDQYLAPDLCNVIVDNELNYIANNVDVFIEKLKSWK